MRQLNTLFALFSLLDSFSDAARFASMARSLSPTEGVTLLFNLDEFKRLGKWVADFHSLTALVMAHRLGIFDILQKEKTITREALTKKLKVKPKSLEVLLHALNALELLRFRNDKISLTAFGRSFLGEDAPYSLSAFLEFLSLQFYSMARLDETIKTGNPAKEADIFKPSKYSRAYLLALNRYLYYPAKMLFQKIGARKINDAIMGSMGVSTAAALLEANPRVKITFGCLSHLVKQIPELMKMYGVNKKSVLSMSNHSGDPEDDTWGKESFDLVFLTKKFLLHPEDGIGESFARKSYQVLNPGGKAVLWETFYPDHGGPSKDVALFGLQDLIASRGGALYTRNAIRSFLKEVGFRKIDFHAFPLVFGDVEFCVAEK